MTIGRDGRVVASPHVRYRQFDDELVVLDLGGGDYFSLNRTGARMWIGLVSGRTPAEVAADLAVEYEVGLQALLSDCIALADELLERGLLDRRQP